MTRIERIRTDQIILIRVDPFNPRHPRLWFFRATNIQTWKITNI